MLVIDVSLVHIIRVEQFSGHPPWLHVILLLKASVNENSSTIFVQNQHIMQTDSFFMTLVLHL